MHLNYKEELERINIHNKEYENQRQKEISKLLFITTIKKYIYNIRGGIDV